MVSRQFTGITRSTEAVLEHIGDAAWITRMSYAANGQDETPKQSGGSLEGLRFAVKDNMDVLGVTTTAGCPTFAYAAREDAQVVHRLLEAGASLEGKTNLDQFACGLNGTRSPYGAVPNAFNPAYVSGGSSSGSAYVVATGQVDFALGTDTAGSGRVPAGLNNIVGLKPSRGLISARGVVPAAQNVDCVSIFARTVAVAADVLRACMGYDEADPFSCRVPMASQALPASFRFGVPNALNFFGDALAEAAFAQLGGRPCILEAAADFVREVQRIDAARRRARCRSTCPATSAASFPSTRSSATRRRTRTSTTSSASTASSTASSTTASMTLATASS